MSKKMSKEIKQIVSSAEEIIKDCLGVTAQSFHCHRFLVVSKQQELSEFIAGVKLCSGVSK